MAREEANQAWAVFDPVQFRIDRIQFCGIAGKEMQLPSPHTLWQMHNRPGIALK
jgi:hypothetical protein